MQESIHLLEKLSKAEKLELIQLYQERERRQKATNYQRIFPILYDWQSEFINATNDYTEVCLCAANRIGKTFIGTYIDAIHLLGEYPDNWPGHRFDHAPLCWALGYSGEKTRDLLQFALFGRFEEKSFSGNLIPKDRIVDWESMTGTPKAMRTVRVKHSSGDISTIQFWSYSQGQHALMGDGIDWFHIDEEPKDQTIYPQVLTRTATGDRGHGGRGILTFTPENGRTDLVIKFMDNPSSAQFFMRKGWDDAPHLAEDVKTKLLESYPAHQREMRTKGVPMLGHGRIYDLSDDFVMCEPFDIPDHWRVIDGMDFGWDHPQARIRLVHDLDTDDFYVTHAWRQSKCTADQAWGATKAWAQYAPTAWPHDGLQHEKGSGEELRKQYAQAGFKMLPEQAKWPDGSNSVEAGIFEIRDLMAKGKFKIFKGLAPVFDELSQYHRDQNGKIVKVRDDTLDAIRYAYMMKRFAVAYGEIRNYKPKQVKIPQPVRPMGIRRRL